MLKGNQIYVRPMVESDAASYLQLLIRNQHVWQQFEPSRTKEYYTLEKQTKTILEDMDAFESGRAYTFGIFHIETNDLVGDISLYEVKTGFFQSASAGYSIDSEQTGKGIATEALRLLMSFAFNTLKLRRIEAGVSPGNLASIRVLEKAGFQREGLMRENLMINGEWKDHYLYAKLSKDRLDT